MSLKRVLEAYEIVDSARASGERVAEWLRSYGADDVTVTPVTGPRGTTDFVKVVIPGSNGKSHGGSAPTLGVIGRLGGLGARPEQIGMVSDGDGALAAISTAGKLLHMAQEGDVLPGDVVVATHVDPDAPTQAHDPVPFMDSAIEMDVCNEYEVDPAMDAILSVDTTRGNRILNHRGFAITPTLRSGYILRISEDLLSVMERTTGELAYTIPITIQDITPYGNGLYHMNSIVQPTVATSAPVVGVAITTHSAVAGSATGANDVAVVEQVVRFLVESAKDFTRGQLLFCDEGEFALLQKLYGSMERFQTLGKGN